MHSNSSFSQILSHWQSGLSELYDSREVAAMFRIVLEDLLGLGKHDQLSKWNAPQNESAEQLLKSVVTRLKTGEPLQQITGFTYFDELKIHVSPAVLIPRPETEELVYEIVKALPAGFSGTIVDWCTGSGCIALALKKHFPLAEIKGYDISGEALAIARKNAQNLSLDVSFECKNALTEDGAPTSVIVSNPPYIPQAEFSAMHKNVTEFEPSLALFVPDGQAQLFYKAITEKAVSTLQPGGLLFFELHENYALETKQLVEDTGSFSSVSIVEDLQGKNRMLVARR